MSEASESTRFKGSLKKGASLVLQGVVGGAAWWLVGAAAVVVGGFLKGTIPAGPGVMIFFLVLGVSASISTALSRRAERAMAERDAAVRQAADERRRAQDGEDKAEAEKRELRQQLAAATKGKQAISTRMQSIVRQVEALASAPTGYSNGPNESQVDLFVGLIEDFTRIAPENDALARKLMAAWKEPLQEHVDADWYSALHVLKARAISLGAEEALGQPT